MSYIENLATRLTQRSDELEETHFDAAMDAQISVIDDTTSNSNPILLNTKKNAIVDTNSNVNNEGESDNNQKVIFDDYSNPNAVHNCLSPYVPAKADRIKAVLDHLNLKKGKLGFNDVNYDGDTILDIGCGDGRVCIASAKMSGCRTIGLDVSPLCISLATKVASEEGIENNQCSFFEIDATVDPNRLLSESCPIKAQLESVSVIFLYTYPTLLMKLIPLLAKLTDRKHKVRKIATLTYHLPPDIVKLDEKNEEFDICFYSKVFHNL